MICFLFYYYVSTSALVLAKYPCTALFHSRSLDSFCMPYCPRTQSEFDAAGIGPILGQSCPIVACLQGCSDHLRAVYSVYWSQMCFISLTSLSLYIYEVYLMRSSTFEDHFMISVGTNPKICISKTWSPGQTGRHFTDEIFNCISYKESSFSIKISLKFIPSCSVRPAECKIVLVQYPKVDPV